MSGPSSVKEFTREEVSSHNKPGDLWIVIDTAVYDISKFAAIHPGGESVFYDEEVAGQDATGTFFGLHRREVLQKAAYARLIVGSIKGEKPKLRPDPPGSPSRVPYGEPSWLSAGYHSPYYNDSHRHLQREWRKFVDAELVEVAQRLEDSGERPDPKLLQRLGSLGINAMRMGPGKHLHGRKLFADIKGEEFDYFHEMIITQELVRLGARGFGDGLNGGMVIGLPPVMNFASPELREEVLEPVLRGDKYICLAVSEAVAGSDVMGIKTFAKKSEDGSHYIVNGTKKWITNGNWADYFTTAVKTDEGFAVLCIPRSCGGVDTRPIKTSYSLTAGTAYITFDNCKVPKKYLIGEDGMGIYYILSNFNHERWVMCCSTIRAARAVCEETLLWVNQRKAFGKPLHSQPVVRARIASMLSEVEAAQNWLENVTYQMCKMTYKQQAKFLAGQVGLLKAWSTRVSHNVADGAGQIFGGRSLTKSGMGKFVEMFRRTYKFDAILGGSEEILFDLAVRQALKQMPPNARL